MDVKPARKKDLGDGMIELLENRFRDYCARYDLCYEDYSHNTRLYCPMRNTNIDKLFILKKPEEHVKPMIGGPPAKVEFEVTMFTVKRNLN